MRRRRPPVTDAHGLVRAADAPRRGLTRRALEYGATTEKLDRPFRGVYLARDSTDPHVLLRVALTSVGDGAIAVIGSAARVHGLQGLPRSWTPQVAVPPGAERRQRAGMEIHVWDVPADEIVVVDGVPVTSVVRTLSDTCRLLERSWAVALVDSALHLRLVDEGDLARVGALMARRPAAPAGRANLALARVGAQSPGETRVRLILTDAGLPPDLLQVPVRGRDGRVLGYADLGYRLPDGGWLVLEFDGRSIHERPEALLSDRRRQNAFLGRGDVSMLRFAWEDTYRPETIVSAVRPLLLAAGWTPPTAASLS